MFDTASEIHFNVRLQSTQGQPQDVGVRWPTDEEWASYLRTKKFMVRQMGRGVTETVVPAPGEGDLALYQKISLNGAPEMTAAEAARVIDAISICQVVSVTLDGVEAEVELRILTGLVRHRLRIPNADQVSNYRRSAVRRLDLPHNQTHAMFNQAVAAKIYDECGGHSDDYPSGVPMPHKHEAARAVIEEIELEYGPKADDESF
jgi:hypothetical protein